MTAQIDPRALVSPEASIAEGVEIGPFAIVEAGAVLGKGTRLLARAHICSGTVLGCDNLVHIGAVLGAEPQHLAYSAEPTGVRIGDRNVFREGVTIHRGMPAGAGTVIGNDCFLMTMSHVGHDTQLGDRVILASGAVLGGHASLGERVFISGNAAIHQHVRVGRLVMVQGTGAASRDVPPFTIVRAVNQLAGVNTIGLQRAGVSSEAIAAIRRAYRTLFGRVRNLGLAMRELVVAEEGRGGVVAEVRELLDFIEASRIGICVGRRRD